MGTDLMGYDKLVEGAMRGVMIAALRRAAAQGLPGDHHFYVSFRTGHPGVGVSADLLVAHPEEMTIVLQHEFWNLEVGDAAFSVTLGFNNVRETLTIPFEAVTGFADPSVDFGLKFTGGDAEARPAGVRPAEAREEPAAKGETGAVVALDAFRKK